jgi:hypothetical protein
VPPKGLSIDPENMKAMWERPTTKNYYEISFLSLCNYYRQYIYDLLDIAKLMNKLTEEKQDFQWITEVDAALETLKRALCTGPILAYPQPSERSLWTQMEVTLRLEECPK